MHICRDRRVIIGRRIGIVGHDHLCHEDAARCRHECRSQQIINPDAHRGIGRQNRARDARHADAHHAEKLRRRKRCQIGADNKRRFGLANEDIRRGAQAFNLGNAGDFLKAATDPADHILHQPEMVEDRDERREKDNHGKRLDREILTQRIRGERAKKEARTFIRIAQKVRYARCGSLQHLIAPRHIQHQRGKAGLQGKSRQHDARPDGAAVG